MRCAAIVAGAAVALGFASWTRAEDGAAHEPIDKESFPVEIVKRPLTLPTGMVEIAAPLGINLTSDSVGRPVFLAPSVYFGITDDFTVGFRHFLGLCFGGDSNGCPLLYNDLSVDTVWQLWRGAGADIAIGAALDAAPIADPFTLSGEFHLTARWAGGPFAFAIQPTINFGITQRGNELAVKRVPVTFPLATYGFGWVEDVQGNKEYLSLPGTIVVQVLPPLAVAVAAALNGPLDPPTGGFNDAYTVPFGVAAILSPANAIDVGVTFTFVNLLGHDQPGVGRGDARGLQLFATVRL